MGYDLDEVREYDDYDVEGEELEEDYGNGEGYEEEEEEVEDRQPTQEEIEYLELRQKLKEAIRKNKMKESASALSNSKEKQKKLPRDNYGSFFGPAQPIIAQRVIQESKSLLENQHLVSSMLNSSHSKSNVKKSSVSNGQGAKRAVNGQANRAMSELKRKAEKLKVARDYSFLSDDAELPVSSKQPVSHSATRPNPDGRPAQMAVKSRQPVGHSGKNGQIERRNISTTASNSARNGQIVRDGLRNGQISLEERRPVSSNGQMKSKVLPNKAPAAKQNFVAVDSKRQLLAGKSNLATVDLKKQFIARSGAGPGIARSGAGPGQPAGAKVLPSKTPMQTVERKSSAPTVKNLQPNMHRAPSLKMPAADSRQQLELKKRPVEAPRDKVLYKQPASSVKPQSRPLKQVSSHASSQFNRPKKRPLSEDDLALSEIRKMFNTQRYANLNDDDDLSDMEANFDEIMKEERRSAKIARREDEEQQRLIEEEERQERMRKLAKKRKHGR